MGSRGYDRFWGTVISATTVSHRFVHKVSGGRLWRRFPGGSQVVWITTKGRKSGLWRTTPLLAAPDGEDWAIAGSNAGTERVPSWVYNLEADPNGYVEVNGATFQATFTQVLGDERARLYAGLQSGWSFYKKYEENAQRTIPVYRVRIGAPADVPTN